MWVLGDLQLLVMQMMTFCLFKNKKAQYIMEPWIHFLILPRFPHISSRVSTQWNMEVETAGSPPPLKSKIDGLSSSCKVVSNKIKSLHWVYCSGCKLYVQCVETITNIRWAMDSVSSLNHHYKSLNGTYWTMSLPKINVWGNPEFLTSLSSLNNNTLVLNNNWKSNGNRQLNVTKTDGHNK